MLVSGIPLDPPIINACTCSVGKVMFSFVFVCSLGVPNKSHGAVKLYLFTNNANTSHITIFTVFRIV